MLDTLPPEILQLIVHELAILPQFRKYATKALLDAATDTYAPVLACVGYTSFFPWYFAQEPHDLRNLSHTNKRLQSIVHHILYRNLAFSEEFGFSLHGFSNYNGHGFPNTTFSVQAQNTVYNSGKKQLVFQADRRGLPKSALQHVRLLCLSSYAFPYHPWLTKMTHHMSHLEEVIFFVDSSSYENHENELTKWHIANIAYVFDVIAQLKNRPRVHAHFMVRKIDSVKDFFSAFEIDWVDFKTLNIEMLSISFQDVKVSFPAPFLDMIKSITSLKSLGLYYLQKNNEKPAVKSELDPFSHDLASTLSSWPNLEHFSTNFQGDILNLEMASRLTALTSNGSRLAQPISLEIGANVTNLEIRYRENITQNIVSKLHKLTTFSLVGGKNCGKLLAHIVNSNPNLVNMSLVHCSVSPNMAPLLFSKLHRLFVFGRESISLQVILLAAPRLRRLVYSPEAITRIYPLEWLVRVVANKQISQDLEVMQLPFDGHSHLNYMDDWIKVLKKSPGECLSQEDCKRVVMPVHPYDWGYIDSIIIDMRALAKQCL